MRNVPQNTATQGPQRPSFEQLARLEPRLSALLLKAQAIKDDPAKESFCANQRWYGYGAGHQEGGLRAEVEELVGWAVEDRGSDPRLSTSAAYDVAYHTIYNALPDCRNCACVGFDELIQARRGGQR